MPNLILWKSSITTAQSKIKWERTHGWPGGKKTNSLISASSAPAPGQCPSCPLKERHSLVWWFEPCADPREEKVNDTRAMIHATLPEMASVFYDMPEFSWWRLRCHLLSQCYDKRKASDKTSIGLEPESKMESVVMLIYPSTKEARQFTWLRSVSVSVPMTWDDKKLMGTGFIVVRVIKCMIGSWVW